MNVYSKDPSAVLDYQFDWSEWLAEDETIQTATITISPSVAETGLTAGTPAINSGVVTVWLSKGVDTVSYMVACKIVTNANRVDERTMLVKCFNR